MSSSFPMGDLMDRFIHGPGLRFRDLPIEINLENSQSTFNRHPPSIHLHHPPSLFP
jgi:hypothetical protein